MTRWLVMGAGGMLGSDTVDVLRSLAADVTGLTRAQLDVTDPGAVAAAVAGFDVVVNCAAWTDVDAAEACEVEAWAVNGDGARHVAAACRTLRARLIQVSTDYVFDGAANRPYDEHAPVAPVSAYGRTKAAGERAVREELGPDGVIVRTAWLYGAHGRSFVATMLRLATTQPSVEVVTDQVGQPTWSRAVAERLAVLAEVPGGIYHATATGRATWYDLARAVFEEAGLDPARVRRTTSEAVRRPAVRPAWSVLGHDRWQDAGLPPLGHWRAMLHAAMPSMLAAR